MSRQIRMLLQASARALGLATLLVALATSVAPASEISVSFNGPTVLSPGETTTHTYIYWGSRPLFHP